MAAVLSGVKTLLIKALRPSFEVQQSHCCSKQNVPDQDSTAVAWVHTNAFVKLAGQMPLGQKLQEAVESGMMFRGELSTGRGGEGGCGRWAGLCTSEAKTENICTAVISS